MEPENPPKYSEIILSEFMLRFKLVNVEQCLRVEISFCLFSILFKMSLKQTRRAGLAVRVNYSADWLRRQPTNWR